MKQHITIEQWKNISSELKVILQKEWRDDGKLINLLNYKDINIGQMIEFLLIRKLWFPGLLIKHRDEFDPESDIWFSPEEFCDALWEIVKKELENYGK